MTSAQPGDDFEQRMNRIEEMMLSAGELLRQASSLSQRNAADVEAMNQRVNQGFLTLTQSALTLTQQMSALTQEMSALTRRVDSLTAASERHDRILDYLLRREAGDIDIE